MLPDLLFITLPDCLYRRLVAALGISEGLAWLFIDGDDEE